MGASICKITPIQWRRDPYIFVDKKYPWAKVPDNNLTIEIQGIYPHDYEQIVESNLHLQDVGKVIESTYGRILEDERYESKVFVNGLFVCGYEKYTQGYDFKPEYIKIDRDRKLADSFQLEWLSSKMLSGVVSDKTIDLIRQGAADTTYIQHNWSYNTRKELPDKTFQSFIDEHGDNAIPVTNQEEFTRINSIGKYNPVFVNETYSTVIKSSDEYEEPIYEPAQRQSTKSKLELWLKNHKQNLTKRSIGKLQHIIEEVTD